MSKDEWAETRAELMRRNPELRNDYDRHGALHTFISSVIAARTDRGWTQQDLANAIGVSQPVIGRLERGQRDPRLSTIVAVCGALNLQLAIGSPARLLAG